MAYRTGEEAEDGLLDLANRRDVAEDAPETTGETVEKSEGAGAAAEGEAEDSRHGEDLEREGHAEEGDSQGKPSRGKPQADAVETVSVAARAEGHERKTSGDPAGSRAKREHESEEDIEARLSYADIQRRHSRPRFWILFLVGLFIAIVAPYGVGRWLALNHTERFVGFLNGFDPRAIVLLSWSVTTFCLVAIFMAFLDNMNAAWTVVFLACLACVQFISGFALLRGHFWFSTNAVYGAAAQGANAADVGILTAMIGLAIYAVLYVLILVLVKKDSPLNVLTRDWASLIMFWVVEGASVAVAMATFLRMFPASV